MNLNKSATDVEITDRMDISAATLRPQYRLKSAANLKSVLEKARQILAMSAVTPIVSRLKTPEGSVSDLSDCGSQGSEYGYSALHEAVISRDLECLDFLLKAGCDLEQRDENGFTALHVATLEKSVEAVDRLFNAGSNLASLTKEGMSSLHIAVEIQDNEEVLALLAGPESNINFRNKVGRTALHLAARCGNLEYLKILLDAGCDREVKDKFGMKAVDAARSRHHEDCVQFLLSYRPLKRTTREFEYQKTSENRSNQRRALLSSGFSKLQDNDAANLQKKMLVNKASDLNNSDDMSKAEQEGQTTRTGLYSFLVPEILICELNREQNMAEKVTVFEEGPRISLLEICASREQVLDTEISIKEKDSDEYDDVNYDAKIPIHLRFMEMENCTEMKLQMNKEEKKMNGELERRGRNELEQMRKSSKELGDCAAIGQVISKVRKNGISKTAAPFLPAILIQDGENGRNMDYRAATIYKAIPHNKINSENLLKALMIILELTHNQEGKKIEFVNLDCYGEEIQVILAVISLPLFSMKLKNEFCLQLLKLSRTKTNGFCINDLKTANQSLYSKEITSNVLRGLKDSIHNSTISTINGIPLNFCQSSLQNDEKQMPQNKAICECENTLELFIKACRASQTRPALVHRILVEFCNIVSAKTRPELKTLAEKIVTFCHPSPSLSNCGIKSGEARLNSQHISRVDFGTCLQALDYTVKDEKCPVLFVAAILESAVITHRKCMNIVLATRTDFLEFNLTRVMSCNEVIWNEEKIAEIFLLLCEQLEDDLVSLSLLADILIGKALSRCDISNMGLSSSILVRMGLLKSEFKIDIMESLKGPLKALKHVFSQYYFPRSLAGLFVSFLAKRSSRLAQLRYLHSQTLKSALLKEILPQPEDQDVDVLGKGLKRICDVLAHGEYWETAYQCSDILFANAIESTRYREIELGEALLVYFGLIKSEVRLEIIKDIQNGLKILQHVANNNYIPQSITFMVIVFLNKESERLELYNEDVEHLMKILQKSISRD